MKKIKIIPEEDGHLRGLEAVCSFKMKIFE
jgi:hypothetical protein